MARRYSDLTLWRAALSLSTIAALLAVLIALRSFGPVDRGRDIVHWQVTKYKDIKTKTVERATSEYSSTIEYPVTPSSAINAIIAKKIDAYSDVFFAAIETRYPESDRRFSQNTSYQIVRYANGYLSLGVSTVRDVGLAERVKTRDTAYWTFDVKKGKAISLTDIFSSSPVDGPARVVLYTKQSLRAKMKKSRIDIDNALLDRVVNPARLANFLAPNSSSIRFDFTPGEVAPASIGQLSVTLPTDNLQLFMQNDTANKLFSVVSLGNVHAYTPPSQADTSVNCDTAKCVALTFDDGPSPYTGRLLDALSKSGAHATFFLIGQNIARYPQAVQRIHEEGHTVGNHSWSHPSFTRIKDAAMRSEIDRTNGAIYKLTGQTPTFLRPPNGAIDANVAKMLTAVNMTGMLWSVDTRDWASRSSSAIYNRVISGVGPGAIVILHDGHKPSADALPRIVESLQKDGYVLVNLDELVGPNPAPGKIISGTD